MGWVICGHLDPPRPPGTPPWEGNERPLKCLPKSVPLLGGANGVGYSRASRPTPPYGHPSVGGDQVAISVGLLSTRTKVLEPD